jgi:uncharacterized protein
MPPETNETARRFVLGRQGLWPGRRWKGRRGVDQAVRSIGSVQFDPLDVVGHNHDLALWGRIVGYQVKDLEDALYRKRTLFESGGNVQIRPIEELPYLRLAMQRKVEEDRWRGFARSHATLLARVTRELEARGPLGARDFEGPNEVRIRNYRAGKETGLALYYLWLKGDLMIASRRRGEKVFDFTSRLIPHPMPVVSTVDAEEHLILQTLRDLGLASSSEWLAYAHTRIGRSSLRHDWSERTRQWREQGVIQEIEVSGWSGRRWLVSEAAPELEAIRSSELPPGWRPQSTTTDEEVVFLAPLEFATTRGRASHLFDFEYIWEVYKPESARRWGYYTLPVLFGDRLRARIELRYDRRAGVLRAIGFWPEEASIRRNPNFTAALGRAMARLADFHGATEVELAGLRSPTMARQVQAKIQRTRSPRPALAGRRESQQTALVQFDEGPKGFRRSGVS